MKLIEFDGKGLLARHGIVVPASWLVEPDEVAPSFAGEAFVKAQILEGKRGKNGLIQKVTGASEATIAELRRELVLRGEVPLLMIESRVEIAAEYYVAIRVDDVKQCPVIMFSPHGGMDVEDHPRSIAILEVDPLRDVAPQDLIPMMRSAGIPAQHWGGITRFIAQLYQVFFHEDAELIEINPLVVTPANTVIPLDAKVELDDSASYRHPARKSLRSASLRPGNTTVLEVKAASEGITLVELDGSIALLTSGAGLGMAVVDHLADHELHPANFVDAPGGGGLEKKIDFVFEVAKLDRVKAIAVYVLQSAQPLSRAIGSLLAALDENPVSKPIVVGLVAAAAGERGMTVAEAKERLAERGITVVSELADLVITLKQAIGDQSKHKRSSARTTKPNALGGLQ